MDTKKNFLGASKDCWIQEKLMVASKDDFIQERLLGANEDGWIQESLWELERMVGYRKVF